ncbi:MAG TPA: arsenate reductase ArsC [Candidatus Acidoferrales bacterium]|jgi:arsenate reductase|nr:arsenate reductase ArsC [Candidatus Acidoferrales bacterium]
MYKPKVLFLDFENSAGSQMAEAYLRYLGGDLFEAFSAGIDPRELNPTAALVMEEVGIDISKHYCKNVEEYLTFHFKFVITLDGAAVDKCPVFNSVEQFQHWGAPDTLGIHDLSRDDSEAFRRFRREIQESVLEFIAAESLSSWGKTTLKR